MRIDLISDLPRELETRLCKVWSAVLVTAGDGGLQY
jgi:hypothetical protein